jgi:hypothetical protein
MTTGDLNEGMDPFFADCLWFAKGLHPLVVYVEHTPALDIPAAMRIQ